MDVTFADFIRYAINADPYPKFIMILVLLSPLIVGGLAWWADENL